MKKTTTALIAFSLIFLFGSYSYGKSGSINITLGGGMKNMTDPIFETVYGTNNIAYSIDFAYKSAGIIEIFIHSDYLSSTGELEYAPKDTTLTIIPVELGLRALFGKSKLTPYLGLGAGYYMLKEENFIGTIDDKKFGFFGEGGLRFNFGKHIFIDLKLKYNQLKYTISSTSRDLGGLSYYGGIGFSF